MTVQQLLQGTTASLPTPLISCTTLTSDSRKVEAGTVFFCLTGESLDGHDFAKQAVEKGAVAVVVERDVGLKEQILVEGTQEAYGIACGNFYGNPVRKLKLIGITGTNGKTTITYIVKGILESAGKKTGLVGTIENQIDGVVLQARHTTPDPFELHALFARMVEAACEYVVMEVSSHGLQQHRLAGCTFTTAGFTNLTPDHLDYHGTMENYFLAKSKLFSMTETAVINKDDLYGERLLKDLQIPVHTFSTQTETSDIGAEDIVFSQRGSAFTLRVGREKAAVRYIQPGLFSVSNALCAVGLCLEAGLSFRQVAEGLSTIAGIPGRFEILDTNTPYTIVRDYAHSPDGLEKLLSTIRSFHQGRIITIFGCAGERDRTKRQEMSRRVATYSDYAIFTADNPRSEPMAQITKDTLPGFHGLKTPYKIIEDRFDALVWGLRYCRKNDFLVLAGKGHEDYQVLSFGSINFNEKQLVSDLLARMERGETWETEEEGGEGSWIFP